MPDSAKPNQIAANADYGTEQPDGGTWTTAAPSMPDSPQMDAYSPSALGGGASGSSDHNSETLRPTEFD